MTILAQISKIKNYSEGDSASKGFEKYERNQKKKELIFIYSDVIKKGQWELMVEPMVYGMSKEGRSIGYSSVMV